MGYAILADVIVAVHLLYCAYVVLGQFVIVGGVAFRQGWARNPWFRISHLVAILIVAFEEFFHIQCPLTTWEGQLRELAGQPVEQGTFVGRLAHNILFFNGEPWMFTAGHIAFAALVLGTFLFAPPRFRRRPEEPAALEAPVAACPR